jgi:hypothetical protein
MSAINPEWPQPLLDLCQVVAAPEQNATHPDSRESQLRRYFGEEEFVYLCRLISKNELHQSHLTDAREPVVLIPDFMGSELQVDGKPTWLNLRAITAGLDSLKVYHEVDRGSPDEQWPASMPQVTVAGPDLRLYARAILSLARYWQVHLFTYDWRQSAETNAHTLSLFLQQHNLLASPLRFVAHGAGGLVARCFIQANPKLWYSSYSSDHSNCLVMVGTPNEGTYWAVQLLTGSDKLIRWLDKLDLKHSLPEVLRIFNSFPATYELLPPQKILVVASKELYQRGTWVPLPVRKHLLESACGFHEKLAANAVDPASMVAIMGCNQPTINRVDIVAPGEFRFHETLNGDGRVAFEFTAEAATPNSQPSPSLATYYVDEAHGSLLRNALVLKSVDEILHHRRTSTLLTRPVITRSLTQRGNYWHRPVGEEIAGIGLERIAECFTHKEQDLAESVAAEYLAAEETLVRAAAGEANPTLRLDNLSTNALRTTSLDKQITLRILQQDIRQVDTELLLIGRYVGAPLTNRLLALDQSLNSWIRRAIDQGLLGAELGKVFYLPRPTDAAIQAAVKPRALLLLGMGEEGHYTQHDLRFLMSNASFTAASLGIRRFAAVVLGTRGRGGRGCLSEEGALISFLQGVAEGLDRCEPISSTQPQALDITLVARDKAQYEIQKNFFCRLAQGKQQAIKGIALDFRENECWAEVTAAFPTGNPPMALPGDLPKPEQGPRITIEQDEDTKRYRFTALIDGAVIPVRELDVQPYFPSTLPGRLMDSIMLREQETYGELMSTLLFPLDFHDYFSQPLTFILDRNTASLPWEMACFAQLQNRLSSEDQTVSRQRFLSRDLQLARQFRTMLSPKPGSPPPRNHTLRILVIADPAPEPELQLPGARREGRAVVEVLSVIKAYLSRQPQLSPIKLDVVERIGESECDFLEIMALILNGSFDVIHFAGHGIFTPDKPTRQGWVFGKDRILTAREIFRARHVPRLVFANACFSAVIRQGDPFAAEELNGSLAGIAEAFFERGVRNYLGTGWPVDDAQALTFAQEFYAQALVGQSASGLYRGDNDRASDGTLLATPNYPKPEPATLGKSITSARNCIYNSGGSTWGAYQHYGQATDYLLNWR